MGNGTAPASPLHTLTPDRLVTRRIKYHTIWTPEGREAYTAASLTEVIVWLYHHELSVIEVDADGERWLLQLAPLNPLKE